VFKVFLSVCVIVCCSCINSTCVCRTVHSPTCNKLLTIGVSVLSTRGFIGSLNNVETDLRLDSCADIMLISHEFYEELFSKPSIKQGMRMRLWQLTDKDAQLKDLYASRSI
jgi:hypothetical protein